jgi:MoxR-like ATPase
VLPDDVNALAGPTLAHRLVLHGAGGRGVAELVVAELLARIPVPIGT